jgi:predicted RNA-binding protein
VGTPESWRDSFRLGNIWGLKQRQRGLWERVQKNDTLLFYAAEPVSGIIGYGSVQAKFRQDRPLWSEEIAQGKLIWPLRFEFDVEHCLPPDKWETDKITSETLKFKARRGFQSFEMLEAQQIISRFAPKPERVEAQPLSLHEELKRRLIEIGKFQKYLSEGEYPFDIGKLDVVWRRVERSVPTYVFEVHIGGDVYHELAKLKHAFDLWNSRIYIVAPQIERSKVENLLSGTFHEIRDRIRFIELGKVEELYRSKKAYLDLEKELDL